MNTMLANPYWNVFNQGSLLTESKQEWCYVTVMALMIPASYYIIGTNKKNISSYISQGCFSIEVKMIQECRRSTKETAH